MTEEMTRSRWYAACGAALAGVAVALGAFGAHGLKALVTPDLLQVWETAARYHMYHALALCFLGLLARDNRSPWLGRAGIAFLLGLLLFCGSLYTMTLTGLRWMGAVTPLGGVCFMAGWVMAAWGVWRARS